ncbi:MAG: hypothetical protein AB7H77_00510 [Bdellovibrionales bacterium]
MSDDNSSFPSLAYLQFRRAKSLCNRSAPIKFDLDDKTKSSAQVALSVEQQVVERNACGLKPEKSKPFRLAVRLSKNEREIVVRRAEKACLILSEYFRAAILGPEYVSNNDPVKQELLKKISRELSRQGNNLNQIAFHLNAEMVPPSDAESMLGIMARSLLAAHTAVRQALAEDREAEI